MVASFCEGDLAGHRTSMALLMAISSDSAIEMATNGNRFVIVAADAGPQVTARRDMRASVKR